MSATTSKEINYWTTNYSRGPEWYISQFPRSRAHLIHAEVSVSYFGNRMPRHFIERDLPEMVQMGCTFVLHTFSEYDMDYYSGAVAEMVAASKHAGLDVYLDPWGVAGVFGGGYGYTVNAATAGQYKLELRLGNSKSGGNITGSPDAPQKWLDVNDHVRVVDLQGWRMRVRQQQVNDFVFAAARNMRGVVSVQGLDGDIAYNVNADGTAMRAPAATARARRMEMFAHPITIVRRALDPQTRVRRVSSNSAAGGQPAGSPLLLEVEVSPGDARPSMNGRSSSFSLREARPPTWPICGSKTREYLWRAIASTSSTNLRR